MQFQKYLTSLPGRSDGQDDDWGQAAGCGQVEGGFGLSVSSVFRPRIRDF